MAIEDMNSIWQYMASFRLYFKELMASSLATIAEYSSYFKTQIIYYAAQAQVLLGRAWAHMGTGFKVAYQWMSAFIQDLPVMAKLAWNRAINWLIQGFHYGYRFCKFLFEIAEFVAKRLWNTFWIIAESLYNLICEIPKLLGRFIQNIPYYLNQMWQFVKDVGTLIKDAALAIKNGMVKLFELALPYLKAFWKAFTTFMSKLATQVIEAARWFLQGLAKRVFMAIGIIYGISSVLVETLGAGINALAMKAFGLNLANYAAFGAIQTGLSIAVATVLTAAVAYYSYKAIRFLYRSARDGISQLNQQSFEASARPFPAPEQHEAQQPSPPAPLVTQFEQQRREQSSPSAVANQPRRNPRRRRAA